MKKVSAKLYVSLKDRLFEVFGENYSVSLSEYLYCIIVHSWDGFYSQSLCEELLVWCRKNGCRFCFSTPDSVMELHVTLE